MPHARWQLRSVLVLVAGLALVCAGGAKWKRYAALRERVEIYSREERRLLDEYQRISRVRSTCGNERRLAAAHLAGAVARRHQIESCEREIRRIWSTRARLDKPVDAARGEPWRRLISRAFARLLTDR
jgi:hypothetical protein